MDWLDKHGLRDRENKFWPLPANYDQLSATDQQLARLEVLRDHSTPEKFVIAWDFFKRVYLCGTKDAVLYKRGFQPSPDFHFQMVYDLASHGRNANAAPRGFAKSNVISIECVLLLLLTRPNFEIILGLATDKLVEEIFAKIRRQLEHNELILKDFGVMRPKRGDALWSHHHLSLLNGSTLKGLSVMGKKRGGRPALFILDDPENDPDSDSESSRQAVIDKFEMILFKQIIPMLESGSCAFWIGTLIDRKSFLYKALKSDDPRFAYWNRKVYRARYEDEDGNRYLLWPEKWSWDVLEARLEEIGPSAFSSEYLNSPISDKDRILSVEERRNEYVVEGEFDWANPLTNTNKIVWNERILDRGKAQNLYYEEKEGKFDELIKPMFRFITFDKATALNSQADYSCIAVMGMDSLMTLWVLDMWLGRAPNDTLMRMIYEKGLAWQVRIVGIESVGVQKDFVEAYTVYSQERGRGGNDNWIGRVFPIKYPARESKADRIASLEWRFNSGRIKYPGHLKDDWPWTQLYSQTLDYTPDLALLPFDDAIDTVSMAKHVIKGRGSHLKRERGAPSLTDRIIKGKPLVPGMPLLSGVASSELSDTDLNILSQKRHGKKKNVSRYRERPRSKGRKR